MGLLSASLEAISFVIDPSQAIRYTYRTEGSVANVSAGGEDGPARRILVGADGIIAAHPSPTQFLARQGEDL